MGKPKYLHGLQVLYPFSLNSRPMVKDIPISTVLELLKIHSRVIIHHYSILVNHYSKHQLHALEVIRKYTNWGVLES